MHNYSFKNPSSLLFGFFVCFFVVLQETTAQNNWELAKKKNGIEVYTKEAPGWPLKAYLGRGMINKPYNEVLEYMYKISLRKEWVADCTVSDILHQQDNSEFIVYFVIDAPWPTSDRDMVLKIIVDTETEKDAVYFRFTALPNYIPSKDDIVRVNKAIGYWKVRKVNDNLTEVSTEGKSTTGGEIPEWLANLFVEDNPYNSILNLRKILETPED